ncbi:MAG: fasciclin domain-containing protein [Acholeplasmataceae bacterium]|nr:fasciclin domain-containing protein [Acholeplasmataceae bacterium]
MKKVFVVLFLFLSLFVTYACDDIVDDQLESILQTVSVDEAYAVLNDALDQSGVQGMFEETGTYTLFAPDDEAFLALLADLGLTNEGLLDRSDLTNMLLYHVVEGTYDLETLKASAPTTLETMLGMPLSITTNGDVVYVDGVPLAGAEIEAKDGMIHPLSEVLIPAGVDEVLDSTTIFTTLLAAADAVGLMPVLSGSELMTLFAPTDDALLAYMDDQSITLEDLLAYESLEQVIQYHVVNDVVDEEALRHNAPYSLTSLEGSPHDITIEGVNVMINDATITEFDLVARNGLIHTIDDVLMPQSLIVDDRDLVDFNKGMLDFNGMSSNVSMVDGKTVVTGYQKTQFNSLLYFHITPEIKGEKVLSDFDYINLIIESDDTDEFLIEIPSHNPMMHVVTLDDGRLELTMTLSALMLPDWIDAVQYFNITPMPNLSDANGSFEVLLAEFSNDPLVTYVPQTTIAVDQWKELGANFEIDSLTNTISWAEGSGYKSLFTRMYGAYTTDDVITNRFMAFDATVDSLVMIEFDINGARYALELTPDTVTYEIDLMSPTFGNADLWKFSTGFNLYLKIDTTTAGSIILENVELSSEQTIIPEEADIIDFNLNLFGFNGMTAQVNALETGLDVTDMTKTQYNSLLYYDITADVKAGKTASDYPYINFVIESADVSEFLIEISGQQAMTHYVRLDGDRLELTMVLSDLLLPSMIDQIRYINLTPMPNDASFSGSFVVLTAEFAKDPLVTYQAQTLISPSDFNEIGSVFTIDSGTNTISWNQGSGFKSLMVRMQGTYVDDSGLIYPYLVFDATVTADLDIEFDIVGTRYGVTLTPGTTHYVIDLGIPTFGNADLWKFSTGFNLILKIDTTLSGSVQFDHMAFSETLEVTADVIDINSELLGFNGMTSTSINTDDGYLTTFAKSQFNALVYFNVTAAMKDGKIASEYPYINLVIESDDVTEFLIEIAGQSAMTHYVTLTEGRIEVSLVMTDLMLPAMIDAIQYINLTPMPNSGSANGSFTVTKAEFSKEPFVHYVTKTVVSIGDFKEVGATFTLDPLASLISWNAGSGFKQLMVRMNGSYADDQNGLTYPLMTFNATVAQNVMIEIDVVGTKYQVLLTPEETSYVIDFSTPTFGNADHWKFSTGFNMILRIDTTEAGTITFSDFILGS